MYFYKLTTVTVVTVLSLLGQVSSQVIVNGPTGISVEAEEGRHRFSGSTRSFVNGPTGFSVEAQERNSEFQEVEEDLQATDDDGNPRYVEDEVDLESIDNDQDIKKFVNGHSGSSVHAQDQEMSEARGVIDTNPGEQGDDEVEQLAKGTHIYTTDWSTDSPEWSYKGGEWSAVSLPDADNHPTIPTPPVPGPVLAVVTTNALEKVVATRTIEPLENMTLHFSYYLSEGEQPSGIPELEVFQVMDDRHTTSVARGITNGVWSTSTVQLPYSGSSTKVVFVGRLGKLGNEIAIDDITIRGRSSGPSEEADVEVIPKDEQAAINTEGPAEVSAVTEGVAEGGDEGTVKPGEAVEVSEKPQDSDNVTEKAQVEAEKVTEKTQGAVVEENGETPEQEKSTEKSEEAEQVTENPEGTLTGPGNDTYNLVEGSDVLEQSNETFSTGGPVFTDNPEEVNGTALSETSENPLNGNDNLNYTDVLQTNMSLGAEVATTGTGISITEYVNDNITMVSETNKTISESTEAPEVNQTNFINITTDVDVNDKDNDTDISRTTLPFNVTDPVDNNVTIISTINPLVTTMDPEIVDTKPSVLNNQTTAVVTTIGTNLTELPANNATGEGNMTNTFYPTTAQASSDITNSPGVSTSDQDLIESNTTTISLIMTNSTSPSGINDTSPGLASGNTNGTDTSDGSSDGGGSSWSAFKVFAVICLLGVAVMGFLYWKRQKRRDDEIPVFSRGSSADYHNPTFSDDDSNFASRGTSQNYKSFD